MVQWSDSFWGEGNRGFEILSSNYKTGAIAIEEFQRFLTERYVTSNNINTFLNKHSLVPNVNPYILKIYLVYNHNLLKLNMLEHLPPYGL
jgi:hypothetical protein